MTLAQTSNVLGTSAYMAPEAFRGDVSVKLDTFSFGVVRCNLFRLNLFSLSLIWLSFVSHSALNPPQLYCSCARTVLNEINSIQLKRFEVFIIIHDVGVLMS